MGANNKKVAVVILRELDGCLCVCRAFPSAPLELWVKVECQVFRVSGDI